MPSQKTKFAIIAPFHTFSEGRFSSGIGRIVKRGVGGKIERLEAKLHRLEQGSHAAENGHLKILCRSERRGSGICSVTISPDGLRTATQ